MSLDSVSRDTVTYLYTRCLKIRARISRHFLSLSLFQHLCRHVYCPAGDFMVNCHCIQPFKTVLGMPILLTIKVIPRAGQLETLTTSQITKYHNTLKKILHTISENISVEPIGLLECKADAAEYYLSLAVVRSLPGHDTKEMIKPFLDYLDNKQRKIEMVLKQTTYSVRLTSRVRLWALYNLGNGLEDRLNFRDLESTVQNYTVLFETNDLLKAYDQKFQVVSPLLYCMQIRLNNTEFEETGGQLTTLHTSRKISLSYYHRTSPSTVQVCADEYMKKSDKNVGMKVSHAKFYLFTLLGFSCWALLVFW